MLHMDKREDELVAKRKEVLQEMKDAASSPKPEPTDIPIEFYDTYISEAEKVMEEWEEALDVARVELKQKLAEEAGRNES